MTKKSEQWGVFEALSYFYTQLKSMSKQDALRELHGMARLCADMINAKAKLEDAMCLLPHDAPNVVIFKGFGEPDIGRYRRALFYARHGIRPYVPQRRWLHHRHSYIRDQKILFRDVARARAERGPFHVVEGFSYGACEAVEYFLHNIDETMLVVAIAGVFNYGKQWPLLAWGERHMRLPDLMRRRSVSLRYQRAQPFAEKILVIATEGDQFVPTDHAIIPGSEIYVYRPHEHEDHRSYYNSHAYLPNTPFAEKVTLKKLKEISLL